MTKKLLVLNKPLTVYVYKLLVHIHAETKVKAASRAATIKLNGGWSTLVLIDTHQ